MCISKDTLNQLLNLHPQAKEYWLESAKNRAIEFRRMILNANIIGAKRFEKTQKLDQIIRSVPSKGVLNLSEYEKFYRDNEYTLEQLEVDTEGRIDKQMKKKN